MQRLHAALMAGLLMALAASYAASQPPAAGKGFLGRLKVGQKVYLHHTQGATAIWINPPEIKVRQTITEIGDDYVVFASPPETDTPRESCYPVHALSGIFVFKGE